MKNHISVPPDSDKPKKWFIDRKHVLAGHGPVQIIPSGEVIKAGKPWAVRAKAVGAKRVFPYQLAGCFESHEAACKEALKIAHAEIAFEANRHKETKDRLIAAITLAERGIPEGE